MYKNMSVMIGINWLWAGTRGLFCEHSNICYGSMKRQDIRGRDGRLIPSENGDSYGYPNYIIYLKMHFKFMGYIASK